MTAEYCLKHYLRSNHIKGVSVSSAGIHPGVPPDISTLEALRALGMNAQGHKKKHLTKKLMENSDVIIAMAETHQLFIKKKFARHVPLFNELAFNKRTSIWDIERSVKKYKTNRLGVIKHTKNTVHYIYKTMPRVLKYIQSNYLLFSDFAQGKKKHNNGFPFLVLYQTKHSCAFLSISIPEKEDGHVIVIPKKRFQYFEDIPKPIVFDLIKTVALIGKSLMKTHGGYNVLLNNGKCAGQFIQHAHFHIIPRNPKDKIKVESWKNKKLSKAEFLKLNRLIKDEIRKTLGRSSTKN